MPVADHKLRPGQIEIEEGRQVFFGSHSTDVKEYRPRQIAGGPAAGRNNRTSTPRVQVTTRSKPRAASSRPTLGVATMTALDFP
jgi:hypothetical protein